MKGMRVLLLDSTYFPVKVIEWQRAMVLLFSGRAEVVTEYSDKKIQSVKRSFSLPKVLRLHNRHKTSHQIKFTRLNVFWRDRFTCQYCDLKLPIKSLTFDHVLPQSKGGPTNWENIVTCCRSCNTTKGSKLLHETHLELVAIPKRPSWSPNLCLRLKKDDPEEWFNWFPNFSKSS